MRLRDIKVGMIVRVKLNALALTTDADKCWNVGSKGLTKLQGKSGTVVSINTDNTIEVELEDVGMDSSSFSPVHLEVSEVKVSVTLTRKEELERIINESIANEAKARQELKLLNTTFTCEEIRNGTAKDGVYSISGTKAMCLVMNKVAMFAPSSTYDVLDLLDSSWRSNTFTLTSLKPSITFK